MRTTKTILVPSLSLIALLALAGCQSPPGDQASPAAAAGAPAASGGSATTVSPAAPANPAVPAAPANPAVPAAPANPAQPGDLAAPPDVAAPPADAQRTASGLASKVLAPGTGTVRPTADDTVKVHYTGWTTDGKMFDSSVKRGEPASFPLKRVIAGWTEGLQLIGKGGKIHLWVPAELGYGNQAGGPLPAGSVLDFEIELVDFK